MMLPRRTRVQQSSLGSSLDPLSTLWPNFNVDRRKKVSRYPILRRPISSFNSINSLRELGKPNSVKNTRFAWIPHATPLEVVPFGLPSSASSASTAVRASYFYSLLLSAFIGVHLRLHCFWFSTAEPHQIDLALEHALRKLQELVGARVAPAAICNIAAELALDVVAR